MNKETLLAWVHSLPDDVHVSGVSHDHGPDFSYCTQVGAVFSKSRTTLTISTPEPHDPPYRPM